ncbi:MAG: hypothetical protein K8S13_15635 [Desulfobacula sp.]|uniref:hypothetical protein n=1 Tax=Desulfobacula sp. TaxID=2593537 RepID=UPI0025BEB196|nr:hypothetical protein [Desulfobacula sp.]MCD4721272.1 hypothetical protein [Desulfobacula sp.]
MKNNLAKRLIFFGNLIVLLGFLSFVSLLQKMDSYDLNQDVIDLSLLYSLKEFDEKDLTYKSIYENTDSFIRKNHESHYQSKQNFRQEIYDWLKENEMDMSEIRLTGKRGSSRKIRPYVFFEYDTDYIKKNMIQKTRKEYVVTQTVDNYLKNLKILASPGELAFIHGKKDELPNKKFKIDNYQFEFRNTYLNKNTLEIRYIVCPPNIQSGCPDKLIEIPIKTKVIKRPSILQITDKNRPQNQALEALFKNNRKLRLHNQYGYLKLDEARRIASDALANAYKSIAIFGFEFSIQKFPFALLFLFFICSLGTLITLIKAKRNSLLVISEVDDDNPLDILIDHILARIFIWIILPVISLIISFPISPLPVLHIIILIFGAIALIILGTISSLISKKL